MILTKTLKYTIWHHMHKRVNESELGLNNGSFVKDNGHFSLCKFFYFDKKSTQTSW